MTSGAAAAVHEEICYVLPSEARIYSPPGPQESDEVTPAETTRIKMVAAWKSDTLKRAVDFNRYYAWPSGV